jgi:hypothetical protein
MEVETIVRDAFGIDPNRLTFRKLMRLHTNAVRIFKIKRGDPVDEREELRHRAGVVE